MVGPTRAATYLYCFGVTLWTATMAAAVKVRPGSGSHYESESSRFVAFSHEEPTKKLELKATASVCVCVCVCVFSSKTLLHKSHTKNPTRMHPTRPVLLSHLILFAHKINVANPPLRVAQRYLRSS